MNTFNQMHNLNSEEKDEETLPQLPDEQCSINELLKNGPYGIRPMLSKHYLDGDELEYITNGTGITEVHEMFEDSQGDIVWFKDRNGRLFEWCRMSIDLRYMGPNVVEGIKVIRERPDSILVWLDGSRKWTNEKEFERLVHEKWDRKEARVMAEMELWAFSEHEAKIENQDWRKEGGRSRKEGVAGKKRVGHRKK